MKPPPVFVDLPRGWSVRTDVAPLALVAKADPWNGSFTPNLTLTLTRIAPSQRLEEYLAAQLEGVAGGLVDPVLLDVDLDFTEPALSFLVAHASTGVDLTMLQHHRFVPDGWVVAACVTAADRDWPLIEVELRRLVRSARCHQ